MKWTLTISYWTIAVVFIATIIDNLGYSSWESLFISLSFVPGGLCAVYYFKHYKPNSNTEYLVNTSFVLIGVVLMEIFLFLMSHMAICWHKDTEEYFLCQPEIPMALINPVFVSLIITALAYIYHILAERYSPETSSAREVITFLSDRKTVSLKIEQVLYVESNDTNTIVYTTDGQHFRNRKPISQWEKELGDGFTRTHRSFIVNNNFVTVIGSDIISIGGTSIPVSRKYRQEISTITVFKEK